MQPKKSLRTAAAVKAGGPSLLDLSYGLASSVKLVRQTGEGARNVLQHCGAPFSNAGLLRQAAKITRGRPRQASHFEAAYEVLQLPRGPIILLEMSVRPAAISSPRIGGCIAIRTAPLF